MVVLGHWEKPYLGSLTHDIMLKIEEEPKQNFLDLFLVCELDLSVSLRDAQRLTKA